MLPTVVENEVAPSFDDEEGVEKAEVEAVAAPQEPVYSRIIITLSPRSDSVFGDTGRR